MRKRWRAAIIGSVLLAIFSVGVGFFQFFYREGGGAEWLTAAGGFALIAFAAAQIGLENMREAERQGAARAKLKPVARLARRSCEQGVITANGKPLNQWLQRWNAPSGKDGSRPLDVLEMRMRETVTLAAEAGGLEVGAADRAFDAFIAAADIINDMSLTLLGPQDNRVLEASSPRGLEAVNHLAAAARELQALTPRALTEPEIPADPKFLYQI